MMIISQNTILFLGTKRNFDLKDVSLVEAMNYIELAAREHWNRIADAGKIKNSTFRNWKVKCVELNDSLSYSAENVTISAALNELCSTARTIAVFDENGLTVIPDFIVLDKNQYGLLSKKIYIKK